MSETWYEKRIRELEASLANVVHDCAVAEARVADLEAWFGPYSMARFNRVRELKGED